MPTIEPPQLKAPLRAYFAEILRDRAKAEGGYLPLSQSISAAYRDNVIDPAPLRAAIIVHRRKLKRIAERDRTVTLSFVELEAIHCYLDRLGDGLNHRAFFENSSLVQELAQSLDATMILPSRLSLEGPEVNYWDWQAMAQVQRTVNLYSNAITFNLIDVQRGIEKPGTPHDKWKRLFSDEGPSSVICIGSPRSNRATERALKQMFRPKRATPSRWQDLPFSFVFLNDGAGGLPSDFSQPVEECNGCYQELVRHVRDGKGWGLIAGGNAFLSQAAVKRNSASGPRRLQKRIRSHGVIAAQRQGHRLVVVVAGLTAPGTLVAASYLRAMTGTLPPAGDPREHAVLWGVVEAAVDTRPMVDGGAPALESPRFVVEPSLWDPRRRQRVG